MHQRYERLAEMMAVADPPAAVELLLRFFVECSDASGGAVLDLSGTQLTAQAVKSVDPLRLSAACVVWRSHADQSRGEATLVRDDVALLPLRHDDELVGLLYLQSPRAIEPAELTGLLRALAKALHTTTGFEIVSSPDERALFRRVLEDSEWNISRAARTMGVTRRTVYVRMRRFGIPRRKRS